MAPGPGLPVPLSTPRSPAAWRAWGRTACRRPCFPRDLGIGGRTRTARLARDSSGPSRPPAPPQPASPRAPSPAASVPAGLRQGAQSWLSAAPGQPLDPRLRRKAAWRAREGPRRAPDRRARGQSPAEQAVGSGGHRVSGRDGGPVRFESGMADKTGSEFLGGQGAVEYEVSSLLYGGDVFSVAGATAF